MAGSSSHQLRFQCSLRHCQEQVALITANHDNYLHFIDDLKTDLDHLSCQVARAQEQFNLDDLYGQDKRTEGAGGEDDYNCAEYGGMANGEGAAHGDGPTVESVYESTTFLQPRGSSGDCDADADTTEEPFVQALSWHDFEEEHAKSLKKRDLLSEMDEQIEKQTKTQTQTTRTAETFDLEKNSETLKCQVDQLQRCVCEKDKRISQLNAMLTRLSHIRTEAQPSESQLEERRQKQRNQEVALEQLQQNIEELRTQNECLLTDLQCSQEKERFLICEARKLNKELVDTKRKHSDISAQASRLIALLRSQEDQRQELSKRYEEVEENYEEQQKKLHLANAHLNQLQERYLRFEKRSEENNMERNLLRQEVLCLKEKEGIMLGKQRSIQEQLIKMERELCTAHDVIREQQCIVQRNDTTHIEMVKRMQETTNDTKRQYNSLVDDYNNLQEEYEKQIDLQQRNAKVIESFRKWKEAQIKSDEATRASFREYEAHIKLLLEEKQMFLEKYRELKRDYTIMQSELDGLRNGAYGIISPCSASDNSIENRIELIRRTSRRVSEKSTSLKDVEGEEESSGALGLCRSRSAQDLLK